MKRLIATLCVVLLNASPALASPADASIPDVPHVHAKPGFGGEACAAMFLAKLGKKIDQDRVFDATDVDPVEGRGARPEELAAGLASLGFKDVSSDAKEPFFEALHADLAKGVASIVHAKGRYRLVLGYDAKTDEVLFRDPHADPTPADARVKRATLLEEKPLVRLRLDPSSEIHEPDARAGFSPADYAQHVRALRAKLPSDDFSVVIEPPFVVLGDEPAEQVKHHAESTVRWAVAKLKKAYFAKDPEHLLAIWLFRDRASYEKRVPQLFGEPPSTPYGYYSPRHRALVMNIATGGGTLVHEIVHPFVRANFPDCPPWFNEGLGSLYEQCAEKDGQIWGRTNWRLKGLKVAIAAGEVPSFEKLLAMDTDAFYAGDRGTNYGQARYLCYYLQEKGLLGSYYRDFVANRAKDPTGVATLRKTLGEEDLAAFKVRWEAYVAGLTFP